MSARVYLFPDRNVRRGDEFPPDPGVQGSGRPGLHPSHTRPAAAHPGVELDRLLLPARSAAAMAGLDLALLVNGGVHHGRQYRAAVPAVSCGAAGQFSARDGFAGVPA